MVDNDAMDAIFRQIQYTRSVTKKADFPKDNLPEIAFAGRSNVGKSSLLNALGGSKKLARTSKQPGRTQAVNLFDVGPQDQPVGRFLDLPGYGYAKVSKSMRKQWAALIEGALARPNLRGVIALMDIRHPLTEADRQLLDFTAGLNCDVLPVLTKADKLSRGAGIQVVQKLSRQMNGISVLTVSSHKGQGIEQIKSLIMDWLRENDAESDSDENEASLV